MLYKKMILYLITLGFLNCNEVNKSGDTTRVQVDTLNSQKFLGDRPICSLILADGFKVIKPSMIAWATDSSDPYSESYLIDGKKLKILQPLKRFDIPDSNRRYFYDGQIIKTTRILFDTLKFDFQDIAIDYGYTPENIFQNDSYILLRNEPVEWTGTSNMYRFIQLFDLKKLICYEFFANYYNCLGEQNPFLKVDSSLKK